MSALTLLCPGPRQRMTLEMMASTSLSANSFDVEGSDKMQSGSVACHSRSEEMVWT